MCLLRRGPDAKRRTNRKEGRSQEQVKAFIPSAYVAVNFVILKRRSQRCKIEVAESGRNAKPESICGSNDGVNV